MHSNLTKILVVLCLCACLPNTVFGFSNLVLPNSNPFDANQCHLHFGRQHRAHLRIERTSFNMKNQGGGQESGGIVGKAAWVAAELLGNAASIVTGKRSSQETLYVTAQEKIPEQIAIERLRADYERAYFISGNVDADLYESECLFADPFASFKGRDRFVNNLANLGLFVSKSDVRLLSFDVTSNAPLKIKTRVLVKLQLNLPWQPVIAWPWGVEHIYGEESGRIAQHIESWEIDPMQGILQVLRPGPPEGLRRAPRKIQSDRSGL